VYRFGVLLIADELDAMTRFGRALSDPIRCRILLTLQDGPAHPADLADELGISRSRLSNHLACLRGCGLVVATPDGRRQRYELADHRLSHAIADVRSAVLAVVTDRSCPDAASGCCP
jgi:DNA-binding transcriptional ArsR family regulator